MRTTWMVVLSCATAACSSDPTSPGDSVQECTGPVTVSVSSGTTPTFDWTPRCSLFLVLVEQGASDRWLVLSPGANGIPPPVQYGVLPPGASQEDVAIPLAAGQTYDIVLGRWTGPGPEDGTVIANQEFTP
jgi:hypothetical protein